MSWQLGHKNSNVTRPVYMQEVKSAERRARRRAKMEARYGDLRDRSANAEQPRGTAEARRVIRVTPSPLSGVRVRRWASSRALPLLSGHYLKEPPFLRHALQRVQAAVGESEPRPGDEVLDGARDEHLAGAGLGEHALADVHR